jgi:protein TonB
MYEAIRQRAPFSTRVTGVTATLLVGAAAGYVLLTGFGAVIVKAVQRPMTVVSLAPPPPPPAEQKLPPPKDDLISTTTLEHVEPLPPQLPVFVIPDTPPIDWKWTTVDPPPIHPPPPTHMPVRMAPKMKPMDPPPYPPSEIRAGSQGTTALELCVDARGRVTSATLARSSGHDVLDKAALKWVRDARFAPATVDGAAQPVCGHPVEYVWNLETLRR